MAALPCLLDVRRKMRRSNEQMKRRPVTENLNAIFRDQGATAHDRGGNPKTSRMCLGSVHGCE